MLRRHYLLHCEYTNISIPGGRGQKKNYYWGNVYD